MELPDNQKLPINLLAGVFNKTTATYKFYWFISLLEILNEKRDNRIYFKDILARMICNSWYPINYFKISFGFFDMFDNNIKEIQRITGTSMDINKLELFEFLITNRSPKVNSLINHFEKQVPYRFLSPWFPNKSNKEIVELSIDFSNNCIYRIIDARPKAIEINEKWSNYLITNNRILLDFCFWNLALYLQSKNPNVPDIPNKLIKPISRSPLIKQRYFWLGVFDELHEIPCIYSNSSLKKENFSVEHFIPFSFVSHDLLWNLIPVNPSINISKSNKLPVLSLFLDKFVELQQFAIKTTFRKNPNNKLLEDYQFLGGSISDLADLQFEEFRKKYYNLLSPLVQIAENMGFEYWEKKTEAL